MDDKKVVAKVKVAFEDDLIEENIVDILSTGLSGTCGFSSVDYSKEEYLQAKQEIQTERNDPSNTVCIEDVEARMLVKGEKLKLQDPEDGHWGTLTLQKLVNGLQKYFKGGWCGEYKTINDLLENGDFDDCDCVLQAAVWGDVIYG